MSLIKVFAEKIEFDTTVTPERKTFWLDNKSLRISETPFEPVADAPQKDITVAGRKGDNGREPFRVIKIQLGMSCNYSCAYCSQKEMVRGDETTAKDIDAFLEMLTAVPKIDNCRFEFWGGEPFVYWKTLKPLAEKLRRQYPNAEFSTVTNGSLLTREIIDWLYDLGFAIAISHDGPGQHVRGDDPMVDNADAIQYAVDRLAPLSRLSFSTMLNTQNPSRLQAIEFFRAKFPEQFMPISELGFIDAYDEGSLDRLAMTNYEHVMLRRDLWAEARFKQIVLNAAFGQRKLVSFIQQCNSEQADVAGVQYGQRSLNNFGQKCGMDQFVTLAVDLRGNVLTCQNTTAESIAPNGQSHNIGHITKINDVALATSQHWSHRANCNTCPVLAICRGSCMFLAGRNFDVSCEASFTDKVGLFAIGFEAVTGYVPVHFEGPGIPEHHANIWEPVEGACEPKRKKVIPIAVSHD